MTGSPLDEQLIECRVALEQFQRAASFDDGFAYSLIGAGLVVLVSAAAFLHTYVMAENAPKLRPGLLIGTLILWVIILAFGVVAADLMDAHTKFMAAYEGGTGSILIGIFANYALKDGPFANFLPRTS